jgi:hypothetical protein
MLRRVFQRHESNETVIGFRIISATSGEGMVGRVFIPGKESLGTSNDTMAS